MHLTVHFEFGSPYTFLAWHRITTHPAYRAVDVQWRPMSLVHITRRDGGRLNREMPNLAKTNFHDLRRFAKAYGIPLWFARSWPTATLPASRGHIVAAAVGRDDAWREAVFRAHWQEDEDIGDPQVLARLARQAGVPDLPERIEAPEVKQALVEETDAAYAVGACGSPFFVLRSDPDAKRKGEKEQGEARGPASSKRTEGLPQPGTETFWGHDRLDWVEARLAGQAAPAHWRL